MRSCALVFTYPGDYERAIYCIQPLIDKVDSIFFCIESAHADFPLPNWITPIIADFNRCTSLHGAEAIFGIKSVYKMLNDQGYDCILKVDSDTMIFRPECFTNPIETGADFVFIKRLENPVPEYAAARTANGMAYAIDRAGIACLNSTDSNTFDKIMFQYDRHEDLTFSTILTTNRFIQVSEIPKFKIYFSVAPYRKSDIIAAHFGHCDITRMKDEIKLIKPQLYDEIFSKESEQYVADLKKYCEAHSYKLKEYKNLYDFDGKPIVDQRMVPEIAATTSNPAEMAVLTAQKGEAAAPKPVEKACGIKIPDKIIRRVKRRKKA